VRFTYLRLTVVVIGAVYLAAMIAFALLRSV